MSDARQENSNNDDKAYPRVNDVVTVGSTRWLRLQTMSYTDAKGKQRKWDMATRCSNKDDNKDDRPERGADAVVIIPLLRSRKTDDVWTVLVEQFRPPVGRVTTEFPAGLIDEGETPARAAVRELLEETGYRADVVQVPPKISRRVCMSPGLTDESVHIVVVEVDLDDHGPATARPDEGENIVLKHVKLSEGLETVLQQEDTAMPIMGLYMFAMGLEMGKNMNTK